MSPWDWEAAFWGTLAGAALGALVWLLAGPQATAATTAPMLLPAPDYTHQPATAGTKRG